MNHSFRSTAKAFTQTGDSTPGYVLKLSNDLSLRTVPNLPGFPSGPCAISDAAAAHTLSSRHALRIRPVTAHLRGFLHYRVCVHHCTSRFHVAQHQKSVDWVERTLSCSSALRSRTSKD